MQKIKCPNDKEMLVWTSKPGLPGGVDSNTLDQGRKLSQLPIVQHPVALMPDAHLGKGTCVGAVIATDAAIVPAAVGVDIGCGMIAVETRFTTAQLPDNLKELRERIERRVPTGFHGNNVISNRAKRFLDGGYGPGRTMRSDQKLLNKAAYQLGSLGGGNHFIEICLDERDRVWTVLHSGSRYIGKTLAEKHISKAKELNHLWRIKLPDPDLAYLVSKTPEFDAYIDDLLMCQGYALENREEMMDRVITQLSYTFFGEGGHERDIEVSRINCHHNFSALENHHGRNVWVTRKGAIRARKGDLGVIPGSMGTKSYIVEGLGNPASYNSCSHGAGRSMSRSAAKKLFTMEDFDREMSGVECRRTTSLIDELPSAYKDIDSVMEDQKDLVKIVHTLKQVVSVKGD